MKAKWIAAMVCLLMFGTAVADNHGVSWESLSEGQREVLGQFADTWDRFPEERQARLARGAARWAGMTDE